MEVVGELEGSSEGGGMVVDGATLSVTTCAYVGDMKVEYDSVNARDSIPKLCCSREVAILVNSCVDMV